MNFSIKCSAAVFSFISLAIVPVHSFAETTTTEWSGQAELGYITTSGNTETSTLNSKLSVSHEVEKWLQTVALTAMSDSTDKQTTAERYTALAKAGYKFNEHDYVFVQGEYISDRFKGFDWQGIFSLGYGRRIINEATLFWDVEIGPGYSKTAFSDNGLEDINEAVLFTATRVSWSFSQSAKFTQELSSSWGADNTTAKSITAVQSSLIGSLAMKVSYEINYNSGVQAGIDKTDTLTSINLVYEL